MAGGQDVTIRVEVEGAREGVQDIAQVDRELNQAGKSARRAGADFREGLRDVDKSATSASDQLQRLIDRIRNWGREDAFRRQGQDANDAARQISRLRAQIEGYANSMRKMAKGAAATLVSKEAVETVMEFGKSCLEAQMEMRRLEASFRATFGGEATAHLQTVYEQADRLGLKFMETADLAKDFFASAQGSGIEGEMQKIFRSVTSAGAALQLSTNEVNGALSALGQMMDREVVQSEDLRKALGDNLPGAFQMAAKAMNMTTAELDVFIAQGKLTAEDLLPKLARALEDEYGKAAENAANTVEGSINRMETEWFRFKQRILDAGPVVFAVNFVSNFLKESNDAWAAQAEKAKQAEWLEKNGFKRESTRVTPAARMGVIIPGSDKDFSPQQYENAKIGMRQEEYLKNMEKEQERATQKALEGGRDALTQIYKNDRKALEKAAKQAAKQREDSLVEARERLKAKGNLSEGEKALDAEYEAGIKENARQLQEQLKKLAGSAKSAGKSASSAAKSAVVSQADYTGELERTRQNIESLQARLGLDKTETLAEAKIKAEQKYQNAISKTNEELQKRVARGAMSQSEAEALRVEKEQEASLERQLAIREAEQKEEEKALKTLETRASFYKELETLSGQYGLSIEYQNELIERQGQAWLEAGISVDDVAQRIELMKQEISPNWWDGAIRGARKFGSQYGDIASQVEGFTTQMGTTIGNTLSDAFLKGKLSAEDFFSSLISMAAQAASNAFIGQIFSGLGGVVGSFFGGGTPTSGFSGTANNFSSDASFVGPMIPTGVYHAGGLVGPYSAVDRAMPLSAFIGAPKFHNGGGFFARDEYPAILKAGELVLNPSETRAYQSGIMESGWNCQPEVNITVVNESGQPVQAQSQATPNASGGFDLQIIVGPLEQAIVGRMKQGKSQIARYQESAYGMNRAPVLARGRGRA